MLLKKGASIKSRDAKQRTPLHYAAEYLQMFTAEALLKAGADANAQDDLGDTPGHKAVRGWEFFDNTRNKTYYYRNKDMMHLLSNYGNNWKIYNQKNENYISLFLDDKHYNEDLLPDSLKAKKESLAKYSNFADMKDLVQGSSFKDMVNAFGKPHKYMEKDCLVCGKVFDGYVFWYWSDKAHHKFIFKDLSIIVQGNQKKAIGGKLIEFVSNTVNYIPPKFAKNVKFHSVNLFESGEGDVAPKDRVYTTKFKSSAARYINWELNLTHPSLKNRVYFVINVDFFKDDKIVESGYQVTAINKKWPNSNHVHGWGAKTPGVWKKGKYQILFSVAGHKIAEKMFQVN